MEFFITYWPIIVFILIQIIGFIRILMNIKVTHVAIRGDLAITNTELKYLKEHVEKQNGRIDKLETKVSKHLESHK